MALPNVFRPSALSFNAYGWKGSPLYNRADVPTRWVQGLSEADRVVIEQQLAYEWLNSGESGGNWTDVGPKVNLVSTNPPFLSGAAGRLLPGMSSPNGGPPRILRGFIRRAESDLSDPVAMARLYFMFNPENITRDYVSYLDQGALDPFNTVFQSGNLVAPPSYMDFTFSLLFDRQEEAASPDHPGVFVDYQYFDLVVRNVIPTSDPNAMNAALPDNGVMMVNPRDITVIFSPQITIQGRPSNARISFTKFTHRMVPVRMQIDLTMRVVYFGPMKEMTPYVKEEGVTASTVPVEAFTDPYNITPDDMTRYLAELQVAVSAYANKVSGGEDPGSSTPSEPPDYPSETTEADKNTMESARKTNETVLQHAKTQVATNKTKYSKTISPWATMDCSALVYEAFHEMDKLTAVGWSVRGTLAMWNASLAKMDSRPNLKKLATIFTTPDGAKKDERAKYINDGYKNLSPGDLLFRVKAPERTDDDHVAFFDHWEDGAPPGPDNGSSEGTFWVFDAASADIPVGLRKLKYEKLLDYTGAIRPLSAP